MEVELLPKVSEACLDSVSESIEHGYPTDLDFIVQYGDHIGEVNPNLWAFIMSFLEPLAKKPKLWRHMIIGVFAVYKILESQAEANLMDKEFNNE